MAPETVQPITEDHLQECLRVLRETREICLQVIQLDRERQHSSSSTSSDTLPPLPERQKSQKALWASLAHLKAQHRNAYMSMRQTKQVTAEAKQEQDRLHLQLQNLYYEQRHLRSEIDACLEFPYVILCFVECC